MIYDLTNWSTVYIVINKPQYHVKKENEKHNDLLEFIINYYCCYYFEMI